MNTSTAGQKPTPKGIILDEYQIGFNPVKAGIGDIFGRRESRVFFLAVRTTHRVSSQFPDDCRKLGKAFRKNVPKDAREFEKLLINTCVDPAAQSPFRPTTPKMRVITSGDESDELKAVIMKDQMDNYYAGLEELRRAMAGLRKPQVKYKIVS